jgi:hypothetical protein
MTFPFPENIYIEPGTVLLRLGYKGLAVRQAKPALSLNISI